MICLLLLIYIWYGNVVNSVMFSVSYGFKRHMRSLWYCGRACRSVRVTASHHYRWILIIIFVNIIFIAISIIIINLKIIFLSLLPLPISSLKLSSSIPFLLFLSLLWQFHDYYHYCYYFYNDHCCLSYNYYCYHYHKHHCYH